MASESIKSSDNYAKASPAEYSGKEWYHGEMTADKAEGELRACGNNCFLVRESEGALILSLLYNGEAHHFNIEYGPDWYRLQASSSQEKFSELTELVAHCRNNAIKITLGVACKNSDATRDDAALKTKDVEAGDEDTPETYMEGEPVDLTMYDWYHEEMAEEEAEQILAYYRDGKNRFLVRKSAKDLVLSKKSLQWVSHTTITSSPEGYCLKGRSDLFRSIPEMIRHYKMFPIEGTQLLGIACDRESSGLLSTDCDADYVKDQQIFRGKISQFTVSWRSCADLPAAMAVPQVVKIGDYVYVSGGLRNPESVESIFRYSYSQDTWTALPSCPTKDHGLAALNGELLVIGGIKWNVVTNTIYTFINSAWKRVLPPMPTPRFDLSTISNDSGLIIAAGGRSRIYSDGTLTRTDIVEVYKNEQWFTTKRLPFGVSSFLASIIGDMCYILGGGAGTLEQLRTTLYTTLSSLMDNAEPTEIDYSSPKIPITWKKLQGLHPLAAPSNVVDVKGMLVAMGGARFFKGTTFVSTYNFHTGTWVECEGAELPVALFRPSVVKLDNNKVMLIGGELKERHFSTKVFIGTFK